MRKLITVFVMLVAVVTVQAQEKNKKTALEVDGVCGMCKARIEKAAIKTKGVKYANWSVETHQLSLIMDETKCTLEDVEKNIAAVGHDTKQIKAEDKVYASISPCCQYRDANNVHKKTE